MHERLKLLRKKLGYTQEEFSKQLGISQNGFSALENGSRELLDRHIKAICYAFNVSESWLRTGEGEMFDGSQYERELSSIFLNLTPASRKFLLTMSKELLKLQEPEENEDEPG